MAAFPAFPAFAAAVLFFHVSEYLLAAAFTPREAGLHSFLVSKEYLAAMACACAEYGLEALLAPSWKGPAVAAVQGAGLVGVALGEALRKAAILTARHNFTHDIKRNKRANHVLVTKGIYGWIRHPGYAGWLLWAVATQALLANPICAAAFLLVAWRFFAQRIRFEEYYLRKFFGESYVEYASRVPSGIPFIHPSKPTSSKGASQRKEYGGKKRRSHPLLNSSNRNKNKNCRIVHYKAKGRERGTGCRKGRIAAIRCPIDGHYMAGRCLW